MKTRRIGCLSGCLIVAATLTALSFATIAAYIWRESVPYQGTRIRELTAQLRQGDDQARFEAIAELEPIAAHCAQLYGTMNCVTGIVPGKGSAERARPLLAEAFLVALRDPNPKIRAATASMITFRAGPAVMLDAQLVPDMPALLTELTEDEEPEVRLAAIWYYEHLPPDVETAIRKLATLATDDVAAVRTRAVDAFCHYIRWRGISESVEDALLDVVPALFECLQDPRHERQYVKPQACLVLIQIGGKQTLISLLTLLNTPAEGNVELLSLGSTLGPDVDIAELLSDIDDFDQLYTHDDPRIREAALRLISVTGGHLPETLPVLIQAMEDPQPNVRAAAVAGVALCRAREKAQAKVNQLLEDTEPSVRAQAVAACRSIGINSKYRGAALERLQWVAEKDSSAVVRSAAAKAVERLKRRY